MTQEDLIKGQQINSKINDLKRFINKFKSGDFIINYIRLGTGSETQNSIFRVDTDDWGKELTSYIIEKFHKKLKSLQMELENL